jgi:hypothetical protein
MKERIVETPLEQAISAIFGLEMTEAQIEAQSQQPKLKPEEVFFGPIAREWHKTHPDTQVRDELDNRNLVGS